MEALPRASGDESRDNTGHTTRKTIQLTFPPFSGVFASWPDLEAAFERYNDIWRVRLM